MASQLTDVYQLSRTEWARMERLATEKNAISAEARWTKKWNPDFNLLGVVAEWLFATLNGITQKRGFGDGGFDYGPVDVKGTRHFFSPRLLVREPTNAFYYALVAVDLRHRRARYCGYAPRETVRTAKMVDHGHGPTFTLYADQLILELPPLEDVML